MDDYSFRPFSRHAFFRQVNTWLLDQVGLKPGWRVVDAACGSGAVTELILERIRGAQGARVVALDISAAALEEARKLLSGARDAVVEFVEARAEEMSHWVQQAADAVIFCNGIHYVEDKARLLTEVRQTLRPGGVFAFNTSFFEGAHLPETLQFYRRWMTKALRKLKTRYGVLPDRTKVPARQQWAPEQYHQALEAAGFRVTVEELVPATLGEQGWLDISRFRDFASGVLPGIPLAQASEVLCDAVRETLAELGLSAVPRNWLSVVATRV